ncbi:MAG TPA: hypothetical protein VGM30_01365 [Puia sp.]
MSDQILTISDKERKIDSSRHDFILSPTYTTLLPNDKFDSIVFYFIKENPCDDCIYELYADKIYPTKTIITLKKRVYNVEYLKKKNPLFTVNFYQKSFFVYSGVEDIFSGDKKIMNYRADNIKENVFSQWGIILDSGKYTVTKNFEDIPFFPSTPVRFR